MTKRTKKAWFDHPEILGDLKFLKRLSEVVFSLSENHARIERGERLDALAAAERGVVWWEERRQAQAAKCADAAVCGDARCRRSKNCRSLRWISVKADAARVRLAAERARWPTPPSEVAEPKSAPDKKKGRTHVRP